MKTLGFGGFVAFRFDRIIRHRDGWGGLSSDFELCTLGVFTRNLITLYICIMFIAAPSW